MLRRIVLFLLFASALIPIPARSQGVDPSLYQNLHWRMIGPHRGGRTVGVAGIADEPNVFFIGVNNGGVWRSSDYGRTWKPIFDDQPSGSIGALAVAPSNPRIMYVGSGEGLQRPDLSVGDGIFKSTDGGATWRHVGLGDAEQIGAVLVDPRDPNKVYVAALGHPYGANEERGVYRSTDGGGTWQKVLYKDENTGAIALAFDPVNPDVLYASLWAARQGPWENGAWQGKTSGLFKSTDGGSNWRQLTDGLPKGDEGLGRIGFAIAQNDPTRMYAMVDAPSPKGGVYRSDDAGEHWRRTNGEDRVWGRGDDFAEVKVDPANKDIIYVANTSVYRSTDGGSTFTAFKGAPGGDDYHTIWINPKHPEIILLASDQGAVVTVNGGQSWSSWYNQPTAQFYHVITDNEFPYNVYGGQQESGSVGIASRGNDGQITFREWHPVAADEYAYIAPDPLNPDFIYGGKVTRFDKRTGQVQNVAPEAVRSGRYRFIRTQPLMFSPLDPHALYLASNVLFKTTNGGETWDTVSPDLSREQPDVPTSIGIYRTAEMARQPRRGVIYALGLSPLDKEIIWAGTDDGSIHISRDGGRHWKNITPAGVTSWSKVAGLEAGHFDKQTAYAAVNRIRLDDLHPHIYRTHDGGATWQEIVSGLPESGPVNAVREDPVRKGLLFAGTERAVYCSFDDGDHWQSLRLNMPATSIRDLVIHDGDIVVGTHGRSFWILDDIAPLRELKPEVASAPAFLFSPKDAVRVRWNMNTDTPLPPDEPAGENPPDGAIIDYFLSRSANEVSIEIRDASNQLVRKYSSVDKPDSGIEKDLHVPMYWVRPAQVLSASAGAHRFLWDLHYAQPEGIPRSYPISAIFHNTASQPTGPWVEPGRYTVILTVDGKRLTRSLEVKIDPRVKTPAHGLKEQFELSMKCYDGLGHIHEAARQASALRGRVHDLYKNSSAGALHDSLASFAKQLAGIDGQGVPSDLDIVYTSVEAAARKEETLSGLQTKMVYLMMVLQNADARPTRAQRISVETEEGVLNAVLKRWESFKRVDLPAMNARLKAAGLGTLDVM